MSGPSSAEQNSGIEIAIIGMAGRFPGAKDLAEYWQNLRDGKESITFFSDEELAEAGVEAATLRDPTYVKAAAMLEDIERFDAGFFGMNPREAEITDPQQRLFLESAWEALEDAGYDAEKYAGSIGVYAGVGSNTYLLNLLSDGGSLVKAVGSYQTRIANSVDFLTTRVSYKLNLRGPSITVQTACSTSLVAVHLACQSLLNGECDMALSGGVSVATLQKRGYYYEEGGIASPDGHCRAFDANAQGTVGGCGVGVVVLKRLEDALSDGDTIRAIIKGSAINNDGSMKVGYTAPSVDGQAELVRRAHLIAEVEPETVTYIEAHGTGTRLGDPIEIKALTEAFRMGTEKKQFCAVGSVKSNIGHLDTAAGVASLIKTVLALKHGMIPPSLNCSEPNPLLELETSPFYINTKLANWERNGSRRRAGVSSFGIGGTNAHVVLEEAPAREKTASRKKEQVLTLSARSEKALGQVAGRLMEHLQENPRVEMGDVAYTLQVGRRAFRRRRAVVCGDVKEGVKELKKLKEISEGGEVREEESESGARVGFMFSGQGTQRLWMGRELYEREGYFREWVDSCSGIVEGMMGVDLRKVLYPAKGGERAAEEGLRQTRMGQPALFVVEYAMAQWLMKMGIKPAAMIGHSLGEYVAACVAGVFGVREGLRMVVERGRLMQEMGVGGMLAVQMEEEEVKGRLSEGLWLAAVNGGGQCVVSGREEAIERLEEELKRERAGCQRLQTRHGFHSGMMEGMVREYVGVVREMELREPEMKYVSNVSGEWIRKEEATDAEYWGKQVREPVRFGSGMRRLKEAGVNVLVEVGPGETLIGLARRQAGGSVVVATIGAERGEVEGAGEVRRVYEAIGRMWERGVEVRWEELYGTERRQRVSLPSYPFERERYWVDRRQGERPGRGPEREVNKRKEICDWFYVPIWKQTPLPSASRRGKEAEGVRWLIFAGRDAVSHGVTQELEKAGADVTIVETGEGFTEYGDERYQINPARREDYEELLSRMRARQQSPQRIVHLWSLRARTEDLAGEQALERGLELGFYSLMNLSRGLAEADANVLIDVVTIGMQEVSGEEQLRVEQATLLALCKVIGQEHANMTCRSIDIVKVEEGSRKERRQIEQLAGELRSEAREVAVAYRGGLRWVQGYDAVPLEREKGERRLKEGGVYLITGGLGRIGLVLASHLCLEVKAKVVLVGRRRLPSRDRWTQEFEESGKGIRETLDQLLAIEERGGEICLDEADVANEEEMREVVGRLKRRWGRLDGVIHAAGVVEQRLITDMDRPACETVFRSKVTGVNVLERVLEGEQLDFCLLMSSLAAVVGGLGLAAYAGANRYMDAFARAHNRHSDQKWMSVNWEGWNFSRGEREQSWVGNAAIMRLALRPNEGVEAFERALEMDEAVQVVVSSADLKARIEQWSNPGKRGEEERSEEGERRRVKQHKRPAVSSGYEEPGDEIEEAVVRIWEELLGIEGIGMRDNFFELGGHSLLATQVVSRMRSKLRVEVGLRALFEEPTARAMAALIREQRGEEGRGGGKEIERARREGGIPLSYAQQRLWFIQQLERESAAYNIAMAVRLRGGLNVASLKQTLGEIERRHEVLRTRFELREGEAVQVIEEGGEIALPVWDLSGLEEGEREEEALAIRGQAARKPFELERGPVWRGGVARLSEQEHVLALSMHHVVSDGWSMGVMVKEFAELYEGNRGGEKSRLGELPIQYADYAVWQRGRLEGEVLEEQIEYWKGQLGGVSVLELPTDLPRAGAASQRSETVAFRLTGEQTEKLKEMSQREGVTLFMSLLAGFQLLLGRYSGQEDIAVGTPIAGRTRAETEGLIGFFVNTLVMRTDLKGNPTVGELLRRVKETAVGAYEHQEVPFEKLVEELRPERSLSHEPLFQVMFILQNAPRRTEGLREVEMSQEQVQVGRAKYELMLTVSEAGEQLEGTIEYRSEVYERERVKRQVEHLRNVVEGMVGERERRVMEIGLLSEHERQQVIVEWNEVERENEGERCVHELIEEQVERTPDRIAVTAGEKQVSYRELNGRANQVGHYLRRRGVRAEKRVGIRVRRSEGMVEAILGVLKSGGAYVPVDGSYPEARQRYMLEDSGAEIEVTDGVREGREDVESVNVDVERGMIGQESRRNPGRVAEGKNLAYVIYTSGSTGEPKGVSITHGSASGFVRWGVKRFGERLEAVAATTSMSFDLSVFEMMVPLSYGGRVVIGENGLEIERMAAAEGVTLINTVPSAMEAVMKGRVRGKGKELGVRVVNLAGEALSGELVRRMYEREGVEEVYNLYGPSETTTYSTYSEVGRGEERPTIGRPVGNTEVYVMDGRYEAAPVGVEGEVYIGGGGVGRGYLNRGDMTAERFVPNVYGETGSRMYRTGDVGRYRGNGEIEYIGRADQQVKMRGYRIELGEIEVALREEAGVSQSAVVVKEYEGGEKRLVGYVVVEEGEEVREEELRRKMGAKLPEYMVPWAIVKVKEMPLTANGKVDRKRLPGVERGEGGKEDGEELSPIEEIVGGIWSEVLRVKEVGREANFFEMGGHSLLATQVVSRVRDALGVEIGLREVFERPTVGGLAGAVERELGGGRRRAGGEIERARREGGLPLSYAQQRLWFIQQLEPESAAYNVAIAVRLRGALDEASLKQSLWEIGRRHEVLRTRFQRRGGQAEQVIEEAGEVERLMWDVSGLEEEEREEEARELIRRESERAFDLERGPVWRSGLVRMSGEEHVLALSMHHVVSDGWSIEVLVRELTQVYEALRRGREIGLAELEVQYADYAVWQRGWLEGEVLEEQLEYWREQLAGAAVLELPTDRPRPAIASHGGATVPFRLSEELTQRLKELSRREGVTLFMTLLAGFQVVLGRHAGQEDVLVGTSVTNRNRLETERLIGFFVNQLVMRGDLGGNPSFNELLRRTRERTLGAYAHQDIPFEKLVEEFAPDRDPSRTPLFQVKLVLQNEPRQRVDLMPGLKLEPFLDTPIEAKFDLMLMVWEKENGLAGAFSHSQEKFSRGYVESLAVELQELLGIVTVQSNLSLASLQEKLRQFAERYHETRMVSVKEAFETSLFKKWQRRPLATDRNATVATVEEEQ